MEFLTIYPGWIIGWSIVGGLLAVIAAIYALALIVDWRARNHNRKREAVYQQAVKQYEQDTDRIRRQDIKHSHLPPYKRPPLPDFPEYPRREGMKLEVDWGGGWHFAVVVVGVFTVIAAIVQALMMIPYDSKYWSWYTITGEVTDISTPVVQLDGNDALIPQYYIRVEGFDEPIFMNDPRIEAYEGETVSLLCGVEWRSFGEAKDRWGCSIRETN